MALITHQELEAFWNSLTPEEKAQAEADRQLQIAEDLAFMQKLATAEAASDALWKGAVKALQEFQEATKTLRSVTPSDPQWDQTVRKYAFLPTPFAVTAVTEFRAWLSAAFGDEVVEELDSKRPKGASLVADTPEEREQLYVTFLQNLDAYEAAIQSYLNRIAPAQFNYLGFRILNPQRIGSDRALQMLDGVSFLISVFKQRGVEPLLRDGITQILLNHEIGGDNWHGYYDRGEIALSTKMLRDKGGRVWENWVQEVFVHEFGHHVHLTYIKGEAKDYWDQTWKPIHELKSKLRKVSAEEMERYYAMLEKDGFVPIRTAKRLKGVDKIKFAYWLRHPSLGEPLITPSQFRLTKHGERLFEALRDPLTYVREVSSIIGMSEEENVARTIKHRKEVLGLGYSGGLGISEKDVDDIRKADPTIDQALNEVYQELGVPSDYGKTNEKEDFAENFAIFMTNPSKLSDSARYRMQRTLWLSGFGGKPVMRFAALRTLTRYLIASRPQIPTMWYENEAGERWVPSLEGPLEPPPEGFVYYWSRFPYVLRENVLRTVVQSEVDECPHPPESIKADLGIIDTMEGRECQRCHGYQSKNKGEPWPSKWMANGTRDFMSMESTWSTDLVLAMVRPSQEERQKAVERFGEPPRLLEMNDAIILAATSCERCLNALLWRYGLDDGYPPFGSGWDESNTKCDICETPGVWDWLLNRPTTKTAKAIPLDKHRIKSLSQTLQDVVKQRTHGLKGPLGKRILVPGAPYDIRAVDGREVTVFIRMQAVDTQSKLYVVSGGMGHDRSNRPVIIVNLNATIDAESFYRSAQGSDLIADQIYPVLLHELTHAADIFSEGVASKMTEQEAQGNEAYYNAPGEVRAYLQEIIHEVEDGALLKAFPKLEKNFGVGRAVHMVLNNSTTWREISPHLNEKNRRLIMKAVGQKVEEVRTEKTAVQTTRIARITTKEDLEEAGRNADPDMLAEVRARSKAMSDRILSEMGITASSMITSNQLMATRVAARYEFADLLKQIQGGEPAIVCLVTAKYGMDIRVYPTQELPPESIAELDAYIRGILHNASIEISGETEEDGGASLTYMTQSAWKHIKDALIKASWHDMPFKVLLNPQPTSEPDAQRHHIVVDTYGDVIEAIKKVLLAIKSLGDSGHSTTVDIDDKDVAYVDGDGSDRIHSIVVDDMPLERSAIKIAALYQEALTPRQKGWEHRKEKDDFAEKNIPPEHVMLWRKMKNQFKGTPDQRAERFMEWLEGHPGEENEFLQDRADVDVRKLQREQQKQVKLERDCVTNQDRYEEAWYKEQERATREKNKLKQLKEKADSACRICPTCPKGDDKYQDEVPFAASASLIERVAARYKQKKQVPKADGKGKTTVYMYSEKQIARRNADKAKRLESLRKNIGNLRTKVKRDLKSSDPERYLTALAVALIDHTYERVGNEESAEERKHYGVTGWRKSHVSFGKGHATIKYTGKSGVQQNKKVTDKAILTALRNAYEACSDDDGSLFDHEDIGKVTATKINAYLEPFHVSAKDLRGFHANREMQERLSAIRGKGGKLAEDKKAREKQLKEEFKKALEETAEAVGHEPSTLKSQYLVPGLEEAFLKDGTVMTKMKAAADYTYDRT